jgi:hypothetical protein
VLIPFYDFPLFIGGPYFALAISERYSYYTDLLVSIHPVNLDDDRVNARIVYHHHDLRRHFPGTVEPFVGAGLELLWVYREYAHGSGYTFYNSMHFHPSVSAGLSIHLGHFRLGTALRTRLGGRGTFLFGSRGGMTLHAGYAF